MPLSIIAQQFSQSPTALNDGILGWRYADMLYSDIRSTVVGMSPGAFAGPIRTTAGYVVLQLMDKRDYSMPDDIVQVRLARMVLPVAGGASEQDVADTHALAESIRTQVNGCDQFGAFARQIDPVLNANPEIGVGVIDQLPEAIQPLLRDAEIGIPTESHRTAQGYELFMICEEIAAGASVVTREQIEEQLRNEALGKRAFAARRSVRRPLLSTVTALARISSAGTTRSYPSDASPLTEKAPPAFFITRDPWVRSAPGFPCALC